MVVSKSAHGIELLVVGDDEHDIGFHDGHIRKAPGGIFAQRSEVLK